MSKFQLWSRDEYGQGQIHMTSEDVGSLIKLAKSKINEINVNNALTIDDKRRNWEEYLVEPVAADGSQLNAVYGGLDTTGSHTVYKLSKEAAVKGRLDGLVKIYLGQLDNEDWYAADPRGNPITKLNHPDLQGKMVYFVKQI